MRIDSERSVRTHSCRQLALLSISSVPFIGCASRVHQPPPTDHNWPQVECICFVLMLQLGAMFGLIFGLPTDISTPFANDTFPNSIPNSNDACRRTSNFELQIFAAVSMAVFVSPTPFLVIDDSNRLTPHSNGLFRPPFNRFEEASTQPKWAPMLVNWQKLGFSVWNCFERTRISVENFCCCVLLLSMLRILSQNKVTCIIDDACTRS